MSLTLPSPVALISASNCDSVGLIVGFEVGLLDGEAEVGLSDVNSVGENVGKSVHGLLQTKALFLSHVLSSMPD